jgi:hypothetical protein
VKLKAKMAKTNTFSTTSIQGRRPGAPRSSVLPSASAVTPAVASVTIVVPPVKEVQQRTREDQEVGEHAEEVRTVLRDEVEARDDEEPEECQTGS